MPNGHENLQHIVFNIQIGNLLDLYDHTHISILAELNHHQIG